MQRLQNRALAGTVRAEQQGERLQIDHLCSANPLEAFNLDPAEAHVAILKFTAKGALSEGARKIDRTVRGLPEQLAGFDMLLKDPTKPPLLVWLRTKELNLLKLTFADHSLHRVCGRFQDQRFSNQKL